MSTTEPAPAWKPGDVANGHVLTHDGTWVLVQPQLQPQQQPPRRRVGLWVAVSVGGVLLLLAALGAVAGSDASTGSTSSDTTSDAAKAEIAWGTIDQSARDQICSAYRVSPAETKVLMLHTDNFTPGLAEETMKILAREC